MKVSRKIILTGEIKEFFRQCGIKGGSSKSPAKLAAIAINGQMPCHPGKKRGRPPGAKNKKK